MPILSVPSSSEPRSGRRLPYTSLSVFLRAGEPAPIRMAIFRCKPKHVFILRLLTLSVNTTHGADLHLSFHPKPDPLPTRRRPVPEPDVARLMSSAPLPPHPVPENHYPVPITSPHEPVPPTHEPVLKPPKPVPPPLNPVQDPGFRVRRRPKYRPRRGYK